MSVSLPYEIIRRTVLLLSSLFFASICHADAPALEVLNGSVEPFVSGTKLFRNRDFTILHVPTELKGARFIRTTIEAGQTLTCTRPGALYAITPASHPHNSLAAELRARGFKQCAIEPFQLFGRAPEDRAIVFRKNLQKDEPLSTRKWVVLLAQGELSIAAPSHSRNWSENDGETLPNGICLPRIWPPRDGNPGSDEPMEVPYLEAPPSILPIDTGRQLFVDDFLIEKTDLKRTFYTAKKYEGNPVFKPETPVELKQAVCYLGHGGVFYDPIEKLVKMWYSAGELDGALAYATSADGFHWQRPELGLPAEGNLLLPHGGRTRGTHAGGDNCLWLDTLTTNASERIKFLTQRDVKDPHWLATSANGQSWSQPVPAGHAGDYCSFFYNPFRHLWVYSVKRGGPRGRSRYYAESSSFLSSNAFDRAVYWCNADRLDEPDPVAGCAPQLYSLNAVAYESLMLGIFYVHLGPPNQICSKEKVPKITELKLGFSRDGFHWQRPDRRAFIPASRKAGTWDRAYLHSTGGVCLIDGDRLLFPYCAFSGVTPDGRRGMYMGASVGYGILRRDGFASMDALAIEGTLTTRPLSFTGKYLFVNADCPQGELRAEILDTDGNVIRPYTRENCMPFTDDKTCYRLTWTGADACSADKPVHFRFYLRNGNLYSFWISSSLSGASRGYLAAGSLGQKGIIDK
ncbi:MAG: glycosyl hydrolase family 32 [Kiritimatiellae bacterium]|jgi:hypothetical protein|nr:glycosyl hydrolase family 32 [Kiritimatiellia bacterium]